MKRALRTALLVLLLSAMGMGKMYAQSFTVGDLNYIVNDDGVSVTVTGHVDGQNATGTLTIPESVSYEGMEYSVTSIGNDAFNGCSDFTGSLTLGNFLTTIGEYAFALCSGFTGSLTIPNSVTSIGKYAFLGCSGFTGSLTIPNSVTTIGPTAFSYCSGFTGSLTIPNSVTEIGYCAFDYCTGFTGTLTIPNSVTKMGVNPFSGCSGLEQIVVEPENPYYYSRFDFSLYSGDSLIGHYQENYNAIIRRNNSETRHDTLVTGCRSTVIPEYVKVIGRYAFEGCNGLTGCLTIPANVEQIEWKAFYNCSGLTSITSLPRIPPELHGNVFEGVSCDMLTVRCGCKEAYSNWGYWDLFVENIVEDCDSHNISIDNTNGGTVSASVSSANMGEYVFLTVTPNEGMTLSSLTVYNASDPSQTVPLDWAYFLMPPYDVVVKAVFVVNNAVGEGNNIAVSACPNPTNGQVKIEADGIKQITISNILGQVIYEGKANGDVFEYDFSRHEAGIYLVRIETASGEAVKKVFVTR